MSGVLGPFFLERHGPLRAVASRFVPDFFSTHVAAVFSGSRLCFGHFCGAFVVCLGVESV